MNTTSETAVRERSILFTAPMVRAILAGSKTMTRRIVKHARGLSQHAYVEKNINAMGDNWLLDADEYGQFHRVPCPYGKPGDRLWVKENAIFHPCNNFLYQHGSGRRHYTADLSLDQIRARKAEGWKTRSSIHLPRWASRITLEVTEVRVQRLHDIGQDGRQAVDVLAEGVTREQIERYHEFFNRDDSPALAYATLWESINGKGSWQKNPWVWAVSFRRLTEHNH